MVGLTLALALTLTATHAAAAPPPRRATVPLELGGLVGYEAADVSGPALRLDGELPSRALGSRVKLSWVGSLGYSRLTESVPPFSDFKSDLIKGVPAARFTVPLGATVDAFGDVGLGLAFVRARLESHVPFFGNTSESSSSVNLMARFGAGAWLHVGAQLKLGAMIEYDPIFGDYGGSLGGVGNGSQSTFSVLAGAMYRL